jgi:hypothetical protein
LPSRTSRSGRPLTEFGLASWPKSRLVKTSKTQKPQKLLKSLWDQEKSCWEEPVWSYRFSSRGQKMVLSATFRGSKKASDCPSGDRKAKTSQTLALEKATSKLFSNFGKKICKTKSTLPCNISQSRPYFSHALKSIRSPFVMGWGPCL